MADLTIRKAILSDADRMSDVLIRSITELCVADHKNNRADIDSWIENKTPDHLREWINQGSSLYVSLADEEIGCVGCFTDDGMIRLLYVAPEARGQGHSAALLKAMETALAEAGHTSARLVSSRTAQRFYERHGWSITGIPVKCHTTDGQPMQKVLFPTKD